MTRTRTAAAPPRSYAFAFDGAQTTGITATGTTAGAFTFGYDANGFLTSSKLVSGAQTVTSAITRDKDGLRDRGRPVHGRPRRRRRHGLGDHRRRPERSRSSATTSAA